MRSVSSIHNKVGRDILTLYMLVIGINSYRVRFPLYSSSISIQVARSFCPNHIRNAQVIVWLQFRIFPINLQLSVLSLRPSLTRSFQPCGNPTSSGSSASRVCTRCAKSRCNGNIGQRNGSNSSSIVKSVICPSWAEQIQDAHDAQRTDILQVKSMSNTAQITAQLL